MEMINGKEQPLSMGRIFSILRDGRSQVGSYRIWSKIHIKSTDGLEKMGIEDSRVSGLIPGSDRECLNRQDTGPNETAL